MIPEHVEKWFTRFRIQLSFEDPEDFSAPFIDLNRPEDRNRIYEVGDNSMTHVLPADGPITDEHRQMLYDLAKEGKLLIFPLASAVPLQADVTLPDTLKTLDYDAQERAYNKEVHRPYLQELSFIKDLLNKIFGFFEKEKQQYENTYQKELLEFNRDCNVLRFTDYIHTPGCKFINHDRGTVMGENNEFWRRSGREVLSVTQQQLKREDLAPWTRSALKVKEQLITGLIEGGAKYDLEQTKEMIITLTVNELLNKNKALADVITAHPEQMQDLRDSLGVSMCVHSMIMQNQSRSGGLLIPAAFGDQSIEKMLSGYSMEISDRQAVVNMLVKEGAIQPFGTDLPGIKAMFLDEQVTQRFQQLNSARDRIPREQLRVVVHHEGKPDTYDYTSLKLIKLDDPRVLSVFEADQAQNNAPVVQNPERLLG